MHDCRDLQTACIYENSPSCTTKIVKLQLNDTLIILAFKVCHCSFIFFLLYLPSQSLRFNFLIFARVQVKPRLFLLQELVFLLRVSLKRLCLKVGSHLQLPSHSVQSKKLAIVLTQMYSIPWLVSFPLNLPLPHLMTISKIPLSIISRLRNSLITRHKAFCMLTVTAYLPFFPNFLT